VASYFVIAGIVYLATIYCRYHYAADGAASVTVTFLAWLIYRFFDTPGNRSGPMTRANL
jgi:hypothetical protein